MTTRAPALRSLTPMPRVPRPSRQGTGRALGAVGRGARRVTRAATAHPNAAFALLAGIWFVITWSTIPETHGPPDSLLPLLALMTVLPLVLLAAGQRAVYALAAALVASWVWIPIPVLPDWPMPWPVTHFLVLLLTVLVVAMYGRWVEVAAATVLTAGLCLLLMDGDLKAWAIGIVITVAFGLLIRWLVLSRRQLAEQEDEAEVERARRAVLAEPHASPGFDAHDLRHR